MIHDMTHHNFLWYGTYNGFVATKGYLTKQELDSYMNSITSACGIEFLYSTTGPVQLKINPSLCPNECIQDLSDAWNDASCLKSALIGIKKDFDAEKKMNKFGKNKLYFDIAVAIQLIEQQLKELEQLNLAIAQ